MIPVTDLRSGTTYQENGEIFIVLSYEHIKMGRGSANIKIKVRNLRTGSITDKSFISGARVEPIVLEKQAVQYLYTDGTEYTFMNMTSYEQFSLTKKLIDDAIPFLKDGMEASLMCYGDEPLHLELPLKMEYEIKDTPPGVKGNTATNIWKDAILDNGTRVKVPLFIKNGDKVMIDTRTGKYIERAGGNS